MLVDGVGISNSSASEILLMSSYYYNSSGSVKSNSINPTMKFEEIKNFASQFVDEENSTIWGLFGF